MKVVPVEQAVRDAWCVDFRDAGKMWEMLRDLDDRGLDMEIFIGPGTGRVYLLISNEDDVNVKAEHGQWVVLGDYQDVVVLDDREYKQRFREAVKGKV